MIALDTSVLARYILNDSEAESRVAAQLISSGNCNVSWSVLLELCWVLETYGRLRRDEIARSLTTIANSDFIAVPDGDLLTWALFRYEQGADFADMIHLASAMNGATEFACFDRKMTKQAGSDTPLAVRTLRA